MQCNFNGKMRLWGIVAIIGLLFWSAGNALADGNAVVRITSPVYDSNHAVDDNIYFTCSVKDSAGADVSGLELIWISNLDGRIGTGKSVTTNKMSTGIHLITLNATNGAGAAVGSDAIKIKVSYVNKNQDTKSTGVVDIDSTGGEGYVVNPMF